MIFSDPGSSRIILTLFLVFATPTTKASPIVLKLPCVQGGQCLIGGPETIVRTNTHCEDCVLVPPIVFRQPNVLEIHLLGQNGVPLLVTIETAGPPKIHSSKGVNVPVIRYEHALTNVEKMPFLHKAVPYEQVAPSPQRLKLSSIEWSKSKEVSLNFVNDSGKPSPPINFLMTRPFIIVRTVDR